MMRTDGNRAIYQIVGRFDIDDEWFAHNLDVLFRNVPRDIRYATPADIGLGRMVTVFQEFTACGACWQETGYHGTYSRDIAMSLLEILQHWNPEKDLAVMRVKIKQKSKIMKQR